MEETTTDTYFKEEKFMATIKKLLEGVGEDGVSIRALAKYTANQGVFVTLTCRRSHGTISLPPQLLGVRQDLMTDKAQNAMASYIKLGCMSFIPATDEASLQKIEGAIRYKLGKATISNGFMSLGNYETFKEEFQQAREDYMAARDLILLKWDTLLTQFQQGISDILDGVNLDPEFHESLRKQLTAAIPSKNAFADSFSMTLNVMAFPTQPTDLENCSEALQKDLKESWGRTVTENVISCISATAQDAFDLCSSVAARYAVKNDISGRSTDALIAMAQKIRGNNVFRNPLLESTAKKLDSIKKISAPDQQEDMIEEVLIDLYQYSKEAGFALVLPKKGVSRENLENMLQMRAA